jgi:signal transduction histidine kinase
MGSTLSPARWLTIVVPTIIAGFIAAHLRTGAEARHLSEHASVIENAARHASLWSALQVDLSREAIALARADAGESFDQASFIAARNDADADRARLRALAPFPGGDALVDETERQLAEADQWIDRSALLLESGNSRDVPRAARYHSVRLAHDSVARLIDFYTAAIDAEGAKVSTSIADMRVLGLLLDTLATMFALGLMGLSVLAVRQYARLWEERNRLAERRAEELDAFAGRVAHDLKNPLGAIAGRIALGKRRFGTNAPVREELERVTSSVDRMNVMIEGLLAFARAGAKPEPNARADLVIVLKQVTGDFTADAEEAHAELIVEPIPPVTVACPAGPLASVLGNLLRNAIKFVVDGPTPERRVRVRAALRGGRARVEIEDTGPGVPAGMEHAIFEPFTRAGKGTRPGLGLGLATVKRIVEAYGGTVFVMRRDGIGSTFVVDLPAVSTVSGSALAATGSRLAER